VDKIRVGMIGTGQIGSRHIEEYQTIPDVEIVAVAGRDESKARRLAEEKRIPNYYDDYQKMLQRDDIEAVDICLHNNLHMPAALAAFKAGKNVFCEKPIAGSYTDGLRMVQAAESAGKKLSIQLSSLFQNETKAAKAIIDQGLLGRIYHARSVGYRRRGRPFVDGYGTAQFVQKEYSGGGAVLDMGVYHLGCILYLLGNPSVERVSGKTYQEVGMDPTRKEASGYNVEELGTGFIRLENNLSLDFFEAWAVNIDSMGGSMILGSKGGISLEPFGYSFGSGDLDLNAQVDMNTFDYLNHNIRANSTAFDSPLKHWIAALRGQVELLPTAAISLNVMLISEGIYISEKLGREVSAEEIKATSKSTSLL
jgi:predicted dehydrogenase